MLGGHVDVISRELITGWAAESTDPNGVVVISVFVDGMKAGEIRSDQPRADLRRTEGFGEGNHGFRFEFPSPLPVEVERRVTVRFARQGRMLGNGDARVTRDGTTLLPIPPPPPYEEDLLLPVPLDPRATLQLFTMFDPTQGLYPLLIRVDFGRRRRASHIHYAAFGEYPLVPDSGASLRDYKARDYLNDLLYSRRFQDDIIPTVLRAFPEKRRLLFVHIPKCAGSDLSMHLARHYPSIHQRLMEPPWTPKEALFRSLSSIVRELAFGDSLFVRGHINLSYFLEKHLIRPLDRVFTIVRDPVEMAISQVNYLMSKITWNVESATLEPDTAEWLHLLGLPGLPARITEEYQQEVCRSALRNSTIVLPNALCHWLGGGTAAEVMARLRENEIEVTDTARYNAWLRAEWGLDVHTRQNESLKFISSATLAPEDRDHLASITQEDAKLYQAIEERLASAGTPSIRGMEPARTSPPG
ncbi:MAG TPA: hypothetical protein VGG99_24275 [Acetobacteraceae bacterium]|jgi:hypothetical protein